MASDKPSSKGQAWFCTTGLPSDVVIEVDDMTFHLHKFPLMSKSRKLHDLITERETEQSSIRKKVQKPYDPNETEEIEEDDEFDDQQCHVNITLTDFPGGSDAFEAAVKFCYGVKIDLSSSNAAPLRCAGEFLQMTEDYSEDNLVSRTERFLSQSVLKNIKDSVKALHSCEKLIPLAEDLGIVQRCIDAIATRASTADPSLFGWPMNDKAAEAANRRMKASANKLGASLDSSWFEELSRLSSHLFKRLIIAMKNEDSSLEIIESCLMSYAKKYFPLISHSINRKPSSSSSIPSKYEQREILEFTVANLPLRKASVPSTTARLLFGLLRNANVLKASEESRAVLEKKIGSQLEQATLDDLLIPSYSYLNETLYDVECIDRVLQHFLQGFEVRLNSPIEGEDENSSIRSAELMMVGKLIDGYLSEIASDPNLNPEKFYQIAVALPERARLYDDGLYRAVDVYLKAHPRLPESEKEKICSVLDWQKLTLEACTHAAQNERLPLRAVVQVLFFEQLQLRQAIAGTLLSANVLPELEAALPSSPGSRGAEEAEDDGEELETEVVGAARAAEGSSTGTSRDDQVLRLDVDSMRTRVHQLERECLTIQKAIEKIDKFGPQENKKVGKTWRSSLTRKFGCKFKTQVCQSHEPTVVEARKARTHRQQ